MEDCLVHLVDPKDLALLNPNLDQHEAAVREGERLSWDRRLAILKAHVERSDPQGDVPYTICLARTDQPLALARGWWSHICQAHFDALPISVTAFAVSAYAVAVSNALRGEDAEARRWMIVGAETTEFSGRPGLSLVVYVRAVKLLAPLLKRLRP